MKTMTVISGFLSMFLWAAMTMPSSAPAAVAEEAPTACEAQLSADEECPHPCEISRGSSNLCLCPG